MSTHARVSQLSLDTVSSKLHIMKVRLWLVVNRQVEANGVTKSVGAAFEGMIKVIDNIPPKGAYIDMTVFTWGETDAMAEVTDVKYKLVNGVLETSLVANVTIDPGGEENSLEDQLTSELEYFKTDTIPTLQRQGFKQMTKLSISNC